MGMASAEGNILRMQCSGPGPDGRNVVKHVSRTGSGNADPSYNVYPAGYSFNAPWTGGYSDFTVSEAMSNIQDEGSIRMLTLNPTGAAFRFSPFSMLEGIVKMSNIVPSYHFFSQYLSGSVMLASKQASVLATGNELAYFNPASGTHTVNLLAYNSAVDGTSSLRGIGTWYAPIRNNSRAGVNVYGKIKAQTANQAGNFVETDPAWLYAGAVYFAANVSSSGVLSSLGNFGARGISPSFPGIRDYSSYRTDVPVGKVVFWLPCLYVRNDVKPSWVVTGTTVKVAFLGGMDGMVINFIGA
jgi:hypothetical protein